MLINDWYACLHVLSNNLMCGMYNLSAEYVITQGITGHSKTRNNGIRNFSYSNIALQARLQEAILQCVTGQ